MGIDKQFKLMQLSEDDLIADPIKQFDLWYKDAIRSDVPFPNSFVLSTSSKKNVISSRVLLLKDHSSEGFKFYTNENSRKGKDLTDNNNASICFWWDRLERQVRISGTVEILSSKESDEYFNSRPRGSQLGAWASDQSEEISSRKILEDSYKKYDLKYEKKIIPRPEYWKGYILVPINIEFWQGRDNRLHDRFLYSLVNKKWRISRLAP